MPAETPVKRRPRTMSGARVVEAVARMTQVYGPFPKEPRLDPADELVFTILSQHTSDTNSSRAFARLVERFGSLVAVADGETGAIEEAIASGGLAKIKAPRIKEVLQRIIELNGDLDLSFLAEMPLADAKAWLRQLPGIGPKSAGIVLSFSLGMPAMAIDTHIYRVCQRLGVIAPKVSVDKAHEILESKVPSEERFNFHVSFINHGRQVCKAQRPRCEECVVSGFCPSRKKFMATPKDRSPDARNQGKMPVAATGQDHGMGRLPHVPQEEG